jgi:hypothetical protein
MPMGKRTWNFYKIRRLCHFQTDRRRRSPRLWFSSYFDTQEKKTIRNSLAQPVKKMMKPVCGSPLLSFGTKERWPPTYQSNCMEESRLSSQYRYFPAFVSNFPLSCHHGRMARGDHWLPKVSLGPTLLARGPPLKRPYSHFRGGPPTGRAACGFLLPF